MGIGDPLTRGSPMSFEQCPEGLHFPFGVFCKVSPDMLAVEHAKSSTRKCHLTRTQGKPARPVAKQVSGFSTHFYETTVDILFYN
jgi:hypothetical protein